jgi:hypothetical protein
VFFKCKLILPGIKGGAIEILMCPVLLTQRLSSDGVGVGPEGSAMKGSGGSSKNSSTLQTRSSRALRRRHRESSSQDEDTNGSVKREVLSMKTKRMVSPIGEELSSDKSNCRL